jgi:hypothetical protein
MQKNINLKDLRTEFIESGLLAPDPTPTNTASSDTNSINC